MTSSVVDFMFMLMAMAMKENSPMLMDGGHLERSALKPSVPHKVGKGLAPAPVFHIGSLGRNI